MTEETMLRDPGPQQIEPLADRRSQKGGLLLLRRYLCAGTAVLRVSSRGRISSAGTTKVTQANAQDRARPAARRGRTSRFKAEAASRDSDS
jgi:hypothetical protein